MLRQEFAARFLRRRRVAEMRSEAARSDLRRTLGAWQLMALGVGAIVGAGIFVVIGEAAARHAGPGVALSFVVVGLASSVVALAYAELAAMIPLGGSGFAYAQAAFGELPAWLVAWSLVLAYLIGNGAIAAGFSANAKSLWIAAQPAMPAERLRLLDLFTAAPPAGIMDVPAALVVLGVTVLISRPVRESLGATIAIVLLKLAVLVLFVVAALPYASAENLTPFTPFGMRGVLAGAAIAFFAFIGFDTVSTAAEEVKDPRRDLPLGILGSLVICGIIYIGVALAMTGAVPYTRLATADPLAEVMRITGNPGLGAVMNVGGVVATLTVLIAFQFGGARIVLNLAREGLVPPVLARVDPRTQTPMVTTYILGVVVAAAAAFLPLDFLLELTNIGTLAVFVAVLGCVVVLRRSEPDAPRAFRMPFSPWLPLVGIAMLAVLLAVIPLRTWAGYALWTGAGVLIYALYRAPQSRGGARPRGTREGRAAGAASPPETPRTP